MHLIRLIRGTTVIDLPDGRVVVIKIGRSRTVSVPDGATAKVYPASRKPDVGAEDDLDRRCRDRQ